MYAMLSGYGIAKTLNRKMYILIGNTRHLIDLRRHFVDIANSFPRLGTNPVTRRENVTTKGMNEYLAVTKLEHPSLNIFSSLLEHTVVPLARGAHGAYAHYKYEDPVKYAAHPARYLVMNNKKAQNVRYFQQYENEIRELLEFSSEVRKKGDAVINTLEKEFSNSMCIHYAGPSAKTWSDEELATALRYLAEQLDLCRYLVFGNDKGIMAQLNQNASDAFSEGKVVSISTGDEFVDLYLASRLCKAFLVTSSSTMGWFLAFFTENQDAVYYVPDINVTDVDSTGFSDFFLLVFLT
ncbi:hypothetical protein Q1695_014249 [Nippostrongylus brasiliensis]|nr:hypothetical protein Q1695_014249 [Nippostrongylus brasiliensis]